MMQEQVDRKKAEIEGVKRIKSKIDDTLKSFDATTLETAEEAGISISKLPSEEDKKKEIQRQIWQAMDELL